ISIRRPKPPDFLPKKFAHPTVRAACCQGEIPVCFEKVLYPREVAAYKVEPSVTAMASRQPEDQPGASPSATRLAEPIKRFHDEAWHTPQGRLVREIIFGLNDGVISTVGFLAGVTATLGDVHT